MSEKIIPLNDEECQEFMWLYRVARAENATPAEIERLKELNRRFELGNRKEMAEKRRSNS